MPIVWLLILLAPTATTLSAWHDWDVNPTWLLLASAWLFVAWRLLLPGPAYFITTLPVALLGIATVTADAVRHVDLLDLAAQWHTFSRADVHDALRPYLAWIGMGTVVIGGLCWLSVRLDRAPALSLRRRVALAALGSALLFTAAPLAVWVRAWPVNGALIVAALATDAPVLAAYATQSAAISPRTGGSWNASRSTKAGDTGTFILVIGESVRSDYLRECDGPQGIRAAAAGAIVACDVTAGSDSTHTSVPLLVSRELPGLITRVPDDATFQRAFAQVGFSTHWYGVQERGIAWPDAAHQQYPNGDDRAALLPLLDSALAPREPLVSIVLHTYGAHASYCTKFDRRVAPYADRCGHLDDLPNEANLTDWRAMYSNAVDDSVGFFNEVVAMAARRKGPVFVVYTPDHGENLLDDRRRIYGHALRHPTRWDARVPAVFWANDEWKAAHPGQWAMLARNAARPLMHADLVPTMLAAASLRYAEPRTLPVNLLATPVPARVRTVQKAIGATVDWETLVREARD